MILIVAPENPLEPEVPMPPCPIQEVAREAILRLVNRFVTARSDLLPPEDTLFVGEARSDCGRIYHVHGRTTIRCAIDPPPDTVTVGAEARPSAHRLEITCLASCGHQCYVFAMFTEHPKLTDEQPSTCTSGWWTITNCATGELSTDT